ncbi:MAG TPA: hypothetical protein VMD57_05380 [Candidatus Baltobacteraceae bacterium]|nr:hypothetical protein [Candidatus Baltobacteraceae bacterium]
MKKSILPLVAAVAFLAGCGDDNSSKSAQATNATPNYASGNPVTAPADYLGAVVQAQKYAEKQIDLSYVNEAIQQFNAAEGRYPKDLQEMIPNYLGKMPQAPYGYKIVYDANSGTIKVVKQ